jgi:hypothetical protein
VVSFNSFIRTLEQVTVSTPICDMLWRHLETAELFAVTLVLNCLR